MIARAAALPVCVAALAGCGDDPVVLGFSARVGGEPFSCSRSYVIQGASVEPMDLRLFVHDVRLVRADDALVPLRLDEGPFQTARVALLDFEDGTGSCRNGSPELRTRITGRVPRGDYVGLRFRIGVPFEDNHGNPDLALPPLNLTAMEWSWNAGYTFLRFDVRADGRPLVFHLGSTGCRGTLGDVERCTHPNRAEVAIERFSPERDEVAIDVLPMIEAELAAARGGAPGDGCMGGAGDPDCPPLFAALGLDASTGLPSSAARGFGVR